MFRAFNEFVIFPFMEPIGKKLLSAFITPPIVATVFIVRSLGSFMSPATLSRHDTNHSAYRDKASFFYFFILFFFSP